MVSISPDKKSSKMAGRLATKAMIAVLTLLFAMQAAAQELNYLYKAGDDGYACFRIPSIITSTKGTLLAFAEGRKINCGDAGDIDLVLKRSTDNGKTWSAIQVVWSDSTNTCGNPAPVVDNRSGKIVLLSTWNLGTDHEKDIIAGTSVNTRRVFVLASTDDGLAWSTPKDITPDVKKEDWTWYATGPGRGVQLTAGKYKNRLVIPCNHITAASKQNYSHAIYSDDGGKAWKLGGITPQDSVNENSVAEITGGQLLFNMRNASKKRFRQIATSNDGGQSISDIKEDTTLIEPVCQGNLISFMKGKKRYLLFSNPASKSSRSNMTLRLSTDDGKSWSMQKQLYAGPSAYSCNTILRNGSVGCFYEAGLLKPYEGIVFETVTMNDFKPR